MSFLSGTILLKNVDTLLLLLWVTTALSCLSVATRSRSEVLPPLATVNEVLHKEQKAECSFTPHFRNSNSFNRDSLAIHLHFFDISIQLKKSITHSLNTSQSVVKAKAYKCY
jgi:hypothetical protein